MKDAMRQEYDESAMMLDCRRRELKIQRQSCKDVTKHKELTQRINLLTEELLQTRAIAKFLKEKYEEGQDDNKN